MTKNIKIRVEALAISCPSNSNPTTKKPEGQRGRKGEANERRVERIHQITMNHKIKWN